MHPLLSDQRQREQQNENERSQNAKRTIKSENLPYLLLASSSSTISQAARASGLVSPNFLEISKASCTCLEVSLMVNNSVDGLKNEGAGENGDEEAMRESARQNFMVDGLSMKEGEVVRQPIEFDVAVVMAENICVGGKNIVCCVCTVWVP